MSVTSLRRRAASLWAAGAALLLVCNAAFAQPAPAAAPASRTVTQVTDDTELRASSGIGAALAEARGGPVAEGNVGGGTGMICHEFKGGIGTASRRLPASAGGWTVGVLVQANYGRRGLLRIDGVPVGEEIPLSEIASPWSEERRGRADRGPGSGSIIGIVATDAILTKAQCTRLATAAHDGYARALVPAHTPMDGDLIFAASTGRLPLEAPVADTLYLGHAAACVMARAIARAIRAAKALPGDLQPAYSHQHG